MTVAIVTGGNTGIGRATAAELARSGFDLGITWHREQERAHDAAREAEQAGVACRLRRLDVREFEDGPRAVEELADALGGLDVLVNNAGYGTTGPFLETTLEEWQEVIDVNLTGGFVMAHAAATRMVEQGQGGAIVNVTSVHEHIPLSNAAPYAASKHGLGGLTKALALELGPYGIRVNSVAPGRIATRLTGQEDQPPGPADVPLGRSGDVREVAALIAWLVSERASYVTGASYVVDGGLMLIAAEHQ